MEQVVLFLVRNTPKTLHNYLRDNGFFRDIHDTLGMVSLTIAMLLRPDLLYKHMIAGANILQTHSYTAEEENSKHKIIQEYKITKDITNTRQRYV